MSEEAWMAARREAAEEHAAPTRALAPRPATATASPLPCVRPSMSAGAFSFRVPGRPQPWQRTARRVGGGVFTAQATRAWEKAVAGVAVAAATSQGWVRAPRGTSIAVAVHVATDTAGGDIDNYAKAVLDGLNGVAWDDDHQVSRLELSIDRHVPRAWAHAEVTVRRGG